MARHGVFPGPSGLLESNVPDDLGSPASSGGETKIGYRKVLPNTNRNIPVNFVQIALPGPCSKLGGGVRGAGMLECFLLPTGKVAESFTTNVSIRILACRALQQ